MAKTMTTFKLLVVSAFYALTVPVIVQAVTNMEGVVLDKNYIQIESHSGSQGFDPDLAGGESDKCSLIVLVKYEVSRDSKVTTTRTIYGATSCVMEDYSGEYTYINDGCYVCDKEPVSINRNNCYDSSRYYEYSNLILQNYTKSETYDAPVDIQHDCGYNTINHSAYNELNYANLSIKTVCIKETDKVKELVISGSASITDVVSVYDIKINNSAPIEGSYPAPYLDSEGRNAWDGYLTWKIPIVQNCGQLINLTLSAKGTVTLSSITAVIEQCESKITNFSSSVNRYNPASGGNVTFWGNIEESTGKPINWTVTVAGRTFSGGGKSVSTTWDGKDINGNFVGPGTYTVTLTAQTSDGLCSDSKEIQLVVEACDLAISEFSGSNKIINPKSGGSIKLSGGISESSGNNVNWTISVAGKTFSGTGTFPSATWDGKDASGKVIAPGEYTATLAATTADGKCSDTKTIKFSVSQADDGQCGLLVDFGSSANVASGNLSHDQELFATRGGSLSTSITLYYNSLDSHSGPLGIGWSHSYDLSLKERSDGSVLIYEGIGEWKLYTLLNGSYVSKARDYSALLKNGDGTFLLTKKNGMRYIFAADGKLTSIADRNRNTATLLHSGNNLTAVTDPVGRPTSFNYDSADRITSINDPTGNSYTFTYNGDMLASVTYPDGGRWLYTYDGNGFMLSKADPLGKITTYGYDLQHRVVSSMDPEGRTRSVTYPEGSDTVRTTSFTEKDGGVWTYTYDTLKGTLSQKTDPEGGTTSHTYDAAGNRTSTTAPDGSTTTYTYDASGNMTSMTDSVGRTTSYTYSQYGQVTSVTGPQGAITAYRYDPKGNMISITDLTGSVTGYEYDTRGNMTSVTDPAGQTTSFTYDQYGNLSSVTDPAGATSSFTFDVAGNMRSQTDASGAVTKFEYNTKNQLTKVSDPVGNITSYTYDVSGNRISQTDANGSTTTYAYNYKGELINVTDSMGYVTTYTYGGSGCASCGGGTDKLTAVTDAKGSTTSYAYDTLGRMISETDPIGNKTTYSYDSKGNLIAQTDANGNTITYVYDPSGRVITKNYPDGTHENFSYDSGGNLVFWQTPSESFTFTYDAAKRLLEKTYSSLGKNIRYEYDASGRKSAMIDPEGGRTTYTYDATGRMTKITDPSGNWVAYNYDAAGRRSGASYSNGTGTTYAYNAAGRLFTMSTTGPSGTISTYQYTYDKFGNRLSVKEAATSTVYTYDKLYRLTAYDESRPDAAKGSFEYDPVGNRTKMVLAKKFTHGDSRTYIYTHNAANQLLDVVQKGRQSPIETVFSYDRNGNLITKNVSQGKTTNTTTYLHDYLNKLTKVVTPDGNNVTFNSLPDGFSRSSKSTSTGTTRYLHDGMSVMAEYGASGNRAARYTLGFGMDEIVARKDDTGTYFYHYDGLGSVTAITDASGNVVAKYDYEPFGRMKEATSSTISSPYTFTGREWDKETGLYYYRARYYDPMEGRFVSKDPIPLKNRTQDQLNSYTYAINNPINFTDPNGENIYGNWCGPGGKGSSKDGVDVICKKHDKCFDKTGATWRDNMPLVGTSDKDKKACMDDCNKQLCDDLRSYMPTTYSEIFGRSAVMSYFRCSP